MLIIIKSAPYESENVMGALFLALSSVDSKVPTSVIFIESGLLCLFPNQNAANSISVPSMSDIIMSLVGAVKFYYIPSQQNHAILKDICSESFKLINGMKKTTYSYLSSLIISSEGKDNLIL